MGNNLSEAVGNCVFNSRSNSRTSPEMMTSIVWTVFFESHRLTAVMPGFLAWIWT